MLGLGSEDDSVDGPVAGPAGEAMVVVKFVVVAASFSPGGALPLA